MTPPTPPLANVLQPLIDVFEWILTSIHDVIGSWGWSIIGMTIVVRALLLPVAIRQFKSMRAMQRLAPEIKALRDKHGTDRERLNQEMMKLYQAHRVNPAGACLPLVFQLPVFISLFYMLRHDLRLDICPTINPAGTSNPQPCGIGHGAEFLGIPDITNKATGATLIILLVLYVGTQVVSTLVMAQPTMDQRQRLLMLVLPVVFVPFVIGFPAGLLVYWITTNLWTLLQQFTIRETLGRRWDHQHETALAAAGGNPDEAFGSRKQGVFGSMMSRAQAAATQGGAAGGASGSGSGGRAGSSSRPASRPGRARGSTAAPPSDAEETPKRATPPPSPRKKKKRSGRRR
jgi:YidC/Oxa1 family membrane protein insertase